MPSASRRSPTVPPKAVTCWDSPSTDRVTDLVMDAYATVVPATARATSATRTASRPRLRLRLSSLPNILRGKNTPNVEVPDRVFLHPPMDPANNHETITTVG